MLYNKSLKSYKIFKNYYIFTFYDGSVFYTKNKHLLYALRNGWLLGKTIMQLHYAHLSDFIVSPDSKVIKDRTGVSKTIFDFESYIIKSHKHDVVWDILYEIAIEELFNLDDNIIVT